MPVAESEQARARSDHGVREQRSALPDHAWSRSLGSVAPTATSGKPRLRGFYDPKGLSEQQRAPYVAQRASFELLLHRGHSPGAGDLLDSLE